MRFLSFSLIQQIFIESLLCAHLRSKHWGAALRGQGRPFPGMRKGRKRMPGNNNMESSSRETFSGSNTWFKERKWKMKEQRELRGLLWHSQGSPQGGSHLKILEKSSPGRGNGQGRQGKGTVWQKPCTGLMRRPKSGPQGRGPLRSPQRRGPSPGAGRIGASPCLPSGFCIRTSHARPFSLTGAQSTVADWLLLEQLIDYGAFPAEANCSPGRNNEKDSCPHGRDNLPNTAIYFARGQMD